MSNKAAIPRRVHQFLLPSVGKKPPSLLHTVLMDEAGAIYYSDEFNNAVVSLDKSGNLRWRRDASKEEDHGFFYPRGLSLGRILIDGKSRSCLAVCDSWKRRVHVLDLDGKCLAVWTCGSSGAFSEVTDVRFISTGSQPKTEYWIVLDKGRHRIYAIGEDGQLLFEIGRGFPPNLARRWVAPGIALERELPAGLIRDFPPFDFLYYPVRILGNCEEALYISEASSWRLKQLLRGNLFPILLDSVELSMQWIDADADGFLGYKPEFSRLLLWDSRGNLRHAATIQGVPVASNLPLSRFCTQTNDRLDFWRWEESESSERNRAAKMPHVVCSPLANTAMKQIALTVNDSETASGVTSVISRTLDLADEFLDLIQKAGIDISAIGGFHQRLSRLFQEQSRTLELFQANIHPWCVGLLEAALLINESNSAEFSNRHQSALDSWRNLLGPFQEKFAGVQLRLDRIARLRWSFLKAPPEKHELLHTLDKSLQPLQDNLAGLMEWIRRWCGIPEDPGLVLTLSQAAESDEIGALLRRPKIGGYTPASSHLFESAKFEVSDNADQPLVRPRSLALTPEGDLLISLSQAHRIVRMDAFGKIIGSIGKPGSQEGEMLGPTGLALDEQNRLWVCEFQNNRIQILSMDGECLRILDPSQNGLTALNGPSGLLNLPGGIFLVADYRNHRILHISSDGAFSAFADSAGTEPEENWHPISFAAGSQGNFWLIDQGNHRIKEMRQDGSVIQIVGGCGLEKGCLYMPITAAVFEDGILAVAQAQPRKLLKLFSATGEEVGGFPLAYHPSAMIVSKGKLYVAGYDDDSIHVYERP